MQALEDVLRLTGLTGGVFLDAEFSAPWSVVGKVSPELCAPFMAPPERLAAFHYVIEGGLVVTMPDGGEWRLGAGDVVLLPHNEIHVMASAPGLPSISPRELFPTAAPNGVFRIVHGGGGEVTRMVCGFLGGNAQLHPLLTNLPQVVTFNLSTLPSGDWIARTFAYAAQTQAAQDTGAPTVLTKVSELMVVEALRHYLSALPPEKTGWLAGLRDPAIGRAIALMHARVSEDWTADALAREVNLSRSAFAERFTALVGQPPMRYLTNWRMQTAMQKLRETKLMVAQIAFEVGYESEASFTRAFRRETGMPPAAWRTQHAAAED
ncbi:MAG: AraC family transcriptional regulator [Alphaproteobacteria bacterium]|nr:AraC family transcriptional regulator [Alphaproteobacteria bacterium]